MEKQQMKVGYQIFNMCGSCARTVPSCLPPYPSRPYTPYPPPTPACLPPCLPPCLTYLPLPACAEGGTNQRLQKLEALMAHLFPPSVDPEKSLGRSLRYGLK